MFNYQQTIDRIIYLASLASDKMAIDPMLDTLRTITVKGTTGQNISKQDQASLGELENKLTNFLIKNDPVRAFNKESLQAQVDKHFKITNPARHAKIVTLRQIGLIVGLAFMAYGAMYLFVRDDASIRGALAVPAMLTVLVIGLAWLFNSVRKALVPGAKRAYGVLTLGIVMSVITSLQYPLLTIFPAVAATPMFSYGGFLPPSTIQYALFFVGMVLYAKQFSGVKSRLLNWRFVASAIAVIILIATLVPHTPSEHEILFDISLASFAVNIFLSQSAAIIGFKVARHITKPYSKAIKAFALSLMTYSIPGAILGTLLFLDGHLAPRDPRSSSIAVLYIIALALQFVSAYRFKRAIQE